MPAYLAAARGVAGPTEPQAAGVKRDSQHPCPLPALPEVAACATLAWPPGALLPGPRSLCRAEGSDRLRGTDGKFQLTQPWGPPPSSAGQGHCESPREAHFHPALISMEQQLAPPTKNPLPLPSPPTTRLAPPSAPPGWGARTASGSGLSIRDSLLERGEGFPRGGEAGVGKAIKAWPSLPFQGEPAGAGEARESSQQKRSGGRVLRTPFEPAMPDAGPIPRFFSYIRR